MSKPSPFAPRLTMEQQLAAEWEKWEYFEKLLASRSPLSNTEPDK